MLYRRNSQRPARESPAAGVSAASANYSLMLNSRFNAPRPLAVTRKALVPLSRATHP